MWSRQWLSNSSFTEGLWLGSDSCFRYQILTTEARTMNNQILRILPGVLFVLGLSLLAVPARASVDEVFDRTVALRSGGSFELQNVNGKVEISGWDRSEVEIHAVKSAKRNQRDLA